MAKIISSVCGKNSRGISIVIAHYIHSDKSLSARLQSTWLRVVERIEIAINFILLSLFFHFFRFFLEVFPGQNNKINESFGHQVSRN